MPLRIMISLLYLKHAFNESDEALLAESALQAGFAARINQIAGPMRKAHIYDQGSEMARHKELAELVKVQIYFCDPHGPWQRGSCEKHQRLAAPQRAYCIHQQRTRGTRTSSCATPWVV
nr:hypothetical protein [Diaphorobacter aerolatus]